MKERIEAVRAKLADWGVDGFLTTNTINGRWLSGFTGSNVAILITATEAWIGTDFRYWEQATQQAPAFTLKKLGRGDEFVTIEQLLSEASGQTFGIASNRMTLGQFESIKKSIRQHEYDVHLKSLDSPIEPLRAVKTAEEVEMMRAAAAITDFAMSQVNELAKPGMTEKALAWELEKLMRGQGADGLAFEIIVAAGRNGALAHHHPSDTVLQEGDAIVIDMGAKLNGYHSDLTRSFYLGNEPDDKFWSVYNLVLKAQQTALENMKAGMTGADIDALARDVIKAAGHGPDFGHSLGHSVGLEIHEKPSLSFAYPSEVPAGSTVTVEPGVYLPDWGGIRIEDFVVMTEDGIEFLSHCPKNPIIPID